MKTTQETLRDLLEEVTLATKDLLDFEENKDKFSEKTREMLRQLSYSRVKEVLLRSEEFFRARPQ